ncbi:aspartate aminotransferase family protein [Kaustia mangrovi]|uniref:Aspartate aminotransferase family protein n=1 Tax=Kaustia mangrovi TaxID=2593653 RepID=A0A7S8HD48_9HYPH|nr:aspartate aminotransferase family protein [Kaustia mangrovi]QPC44412.1 aspartate aminotransferase family protein [Kaustia mangrovi]
MPFDITTLMAEHQGRNYALHEAHVNPRFAKVLKLIGFDRCYVRASGPHLWDDHGRQYLDMLAGYGVFHAGRNHPEIRRALTEFMAADYPSLVQMEAPLLSGVLAEELKARVGYGLDTVYFTSTGAEGNETAIKFARCATGKSHILFASSAFHGLTNGALSVNGGQDFRAGFDPLLPDTGMVPFGDAAALEQALRAGNVAAFIVEPVQGKGVNIPPDGYLAEASRLCRKYGALFVADEVQCGMGRTGRFLAIHHEEGAEPDIVVLSKALSGGYVPVGAVLTRREIYDKVFSTLDRAVVHSSTFGQGSLAMVAGLASLAVLDDERLMENATRMGDILGRGLAEMAGRYEFIHDVRWRGLMLAIEFGRPKSFSLKTGWSTITRLNPDLFCQGVTIPLLEDHGILTQVAGHHLTTIKLIPPLVIDESDVGWFLEGFDAVMAQLHKFPGPLWESLFRIAKNSVSSGNGRRAAAG